MFKSKKLLTDEHFKQNRAGLSVSSSKFLPSFCLNRPILCGGIAFAMPSTSQVCPMMSGSSRLARKVYSSYWVERPQHSQWPHSGQLRVA